MLWSSVSSLDPHICNSLESPYSNIESEGIVARVFVLIMIGELFVLLTI